MLETALSLAYVKVLYFDAFCLELLVYMSLLIRFSIPAMKVYGHFLIILTSIPTCRLLLGVEA